LPKISEFYGIAVYMYYLEHGVPHFHAQYQGDEVIIGIQDLSRLEGGLKPRAMGLVMEWAALHQAELLAVWRQALNHETLGKIPPLE
jgi:hypothetical protein